jgi:hypothetical protein
VRRILQRAQQIAARDLGREHAATLDYSRPNDVFVLAIARNQAGAGDICHKTARCTTGQNICADFRNWHTACSFCDPWPLAKR